MGAALEDLRRATALARELGHAQVERWATGNLAEFLHWMGHTEEALRLARRAHALGLRFFIEHPVAVDAVLLARVHLARGDIKEARGLLEWVEAHCEPERVPPNTQALRRLVTLRLHEAAGAPHAPSTWEALLAEAEPNTSGDELTELLHEATLSALGAGRREEARAWLTRAERTGAASPLWRERLDTLRIQLEAP
jgi:hypothetical protein